MASTFNPSDIQQLVTRARQATAAGQFAQARQTWQIILDLLPPGAPERSGVMREIDRLNDRMNPKPGIDWRKRLGPFGVVLAFLAKFKTGAFLILTKAKFLLSMLAFIGLYWALFGWWFAVGFFGCILIHELGHYVVVRGYGFKAELPMFIPGFGAYVRWNGSPGIEPRIRANIALAGPFFGFLAGVLALLIYVSTGKPVWLAVAEIAGWLNLLNLIPVGMFDGGKAMDAISTNQRLAILTLSAAMIYLTWDENFRNILPWLGIAGATGYRLYKRDTIEPAAELTGYYFIALALANGFLSWFCLHFGHLGQY